MVSYSAAIGQMLLNVAGNSEYAGFIVGLFLMGALAFLAYKRGFDTLGTGMVLYPTAVALTLGGWLPKTLDGIALLGIGVLWGLAIVKAFGTPIGEGSDIQKFYIIMLCWNGLLLATGGFATDGTVIQSSGGTNQTMSDVSNTGSTSNFLSGVISFVLMGGIVGFFAAIGLDPAITTVIRLPLIAIGVFAIYPLMIKIISLIASLGIIGKIVVGIGFIALGGAVINDFVHFF